MDVDVSNYIGVLILFGAYFLKCDPSRSPSHPYTIVINYNTYPRPSVSLPAVYFKRQAGKVWQLRDVFAADRSTCDRLRFGPSDAFFCSLGRW